MRWLSILAISSILFSVPAIGQQSNSVAVLNIESASALSDASEPTVRIGLATGAHSVTITTADSSLIAISPDEQPKPLATSKVSVVPRAYRPPVIENYRFEIPNLATRDEAEQLAKDAREATGEIVEVYPDEKTMTYRVRIGELKETLEVANAYKDFLNEKGFAEVEMVSEKITQPSADAIALSEQLKTKPNSGVRSLMTKKLPGSDEKPRLVKTTGTSTPSSDSQNPVLDPNLKEIIVNGGNATAKFSTFKPIAFSSTSERFLPVRVNGKSYRGKIEVFVNSRGNLTVVNVVSLEDYLRGVVPNELNLPELEALKAQAVAARTYAWANLNGFAAEGFDLLPTTRSQVYRGFSSENAMTTQAITETRGVIATHNGKPINAMYSSTCGGRTENSENIYEFNEPYLRGVECSLENEGQVEPSLIKTSREPAAVKDENKLARVREAALLSVSGFPIATTRFSDEWFDSSPTPTEIQFWFAQVSARLRPPAVAVTFPKTNVVVSNNLQPAASPTPTPLPTPTPTPLPTAPADAHPGSIANFLAAYFYAPNYADTLLSTADINYQLSFADGKDVPQNSRANIAVLLRDGWLSLYPDATLRPVQPMSRGKLIQLLFRLAQKKNWLANLQAGTAKMAAEGKLFLRSGKTEKQITLQPDAFLFRQFGEVMYQVRDTAIIGGENVSYQTNFKGEISYLEIKPSPSTASADRNSPFSSWNVNLSPSAVQSRLSRFVRGFGTLLDLNIKSQGISRRTTELEIIGTNGKFSLKGGAIRSALRLKEQLFVLNKRYDSNGRAVGYSFTGRGWGHGVGMCQYGAYGLAKQGYKYDEILKHYYTGIALMKAY